MGFLSRKKKNVEPVVTEETHPLEEELQGMEAAVPERADHVADYRDQFDGSAPAAPQAVAPDPEPPVRDAPLNQAPQPQVEQVPAPQPPAPQGAALAPAPAPDPAPAAPAPQGAAPAPAPAPAPAAPAPVEQDAPAVEQAVNAEAPVNDDDESGDGRMKAIDLIAPTRLDFLKPQEAPAPDPVDTADVIAFANQKGGVAKTTTTLNLAVALAESGHRVLCVDLDPQGNLTMSQGIDPDKVEHSLYDVLVNDMPISEIIVKREIDIAVASIDLAGAEIAMSTKIGRERSLEKALKEVAADYDFVCIDTPPSLGLLTINALTAANKVIVPVQCEYLSMRGLVQLQNTLRMIQENLNPDVHIEGILPTMLDTRTIHAKEAVEILEENFGDLVFQSRIRKAIKFAEAPVKGASVLKYDSESSAAGYYRDLAKEVLSHGSA
jgi:chromosome partitioning protein